MSTVEAIVTWTIGDGFAWITGGAAGIISGGLAILGYWWMQDRDAKRREPIDIVNTLEGFGITPRPEERQAAEKAMTAGMNMGPLRRRLAAAAAATTPQYADIPAVTREPDVHVGRHLDPTEVPAIEGDDVPEYVGRHRLDPALTAQQIRALTTQTREIRVQYTLNPAWRAG